MMKRTFYLQLNGAKVSLSCVRADRKMMRIITLCSHCIPALLAAALSGCVINPSFHKLPAKEQAALRPPATSVAKIAAGQQATALPSEVLTADSIRVFKFDSQLLNQYIDSSPNELTHLYIYGSFCKPCAAELPEMVQLSVKHKDVNLLLVSTESWASLKYVKQFLAKSSIGFPTYILDLDKYGDEYNAGKRYHKFVNEVYPEHPWVGGFPTHLILDRQHRVRYAAVGAGKFRVAVLDSLMRAGR